MIDFGLSDDQEALQRAAREFLATECPPALVRDTAREPDGVPGADLLLVAARTKAGSGPRGVSCFLVETDGPGRRVRPSETIDLTRRLGEVELRDATVGRDALLGREGEGWPLVARLLDLGA